MPNFISAYQGDDSNVVVTVTEDYAKAAGLTTLKSEPATDANGRPLAPREGNRTSVDSTASTSTSGGKTASNKEGSK